VPAATTAAVRPRLPTAAPAASAPGGIPAAAIPAAAVDALPTAAPGAAVGPASKAVGVQRRPRPAEEDDTGVVLPSNALTGAGLEVSFGSLGFGADEPLDFGAGPAALVGAAPGQPASGSAAPAAAAAATAAAAPTGVAPGLGGSGLGGVQLGVADATGAAPSSLAPGVGRQERVGAPGAGTAGSSSSSNGVIGGAPGLPTPGFEPSNSYVPYQQQMNAFAMGAHYYEGGEYGVQPPQRGLGGEFYSGVPYQVPGSGKFNVPPGAPADGTAGGVGAVGAPAGGAAPGGPAGAPAAPMQPFLPAYGGYGPQFGMYPPPQAFGYPNAFNAPPMRYPPSQMGPGPMGVNMYQGGAGGLGGKGGSGGGRPPRGGDLVRAATLRDRGGVAG